MGSHKNDNFSDVVPSLKHNAESDRGEVFLSREYASKLAYKNLDRDIVLLATDTQITELEALIAAISVEPLEETLTAGNGTGANTILAENYEVIETVGRDVFAMGGGDIELVIDYDGAYDTGLYFSSGYGALFSNGYSATAEAYTAPAGADAFGSSVSLTASGSNGGGPSRGSTHVLVANHALSGFEAQSNRAGLVIFSTLVAGTSVADDTDGNSQTKGASLLSNGFTIELNTTYCLSVSSKEVVIEDGSNYSTVISSNIGSILGDNSVMIASDDTIVGDGSGLSFSNAASLASLSGRMQGTHSSTAIIASLTPVLGISGGAITASAIIASNDSEIEGSSNTALIATDAVSFPALSSPTGVLVAATDTKVIDVQDYTAYFDRIVEHVQITPANTADALGVDGQFGFDDDYVYYKTSTGWKRAALAAF